ncbi:MAG: hypothetical protein HeimC3_00960 [Candidatus Heimdallarchaeota archaeon LC_3]|nr:MAG: hypothetical protein HeimC3_00960 [Candidatus Heimdallarchaeota archaeon LC_3]
MVELTIDQAIITITNPNNLIAVIYMLTMLAVWWSARFWQTPEFVGRRARFFSPKWTILFQKKFRSKLLDDITSAVWFWGFTITIFLMWGISLFQGGVAWRIGVFVLATVTTSLLIQILFPVIVPMRYPDFNKPTKNFEPIRLITHKNTDIVNGLLYNGLPSNHFGMMLTGAFICFYVYNYDPWYVWIVIAIIFLFIAFIFAFSVIYLGEHYPHDLLASLIVYPIGLVVYNEISIIIFPF